MTPDHLIGLIGVGILLLLLVAGVPIGVALGLVGLGGMSVMLGIEPALIKSGVLLFDTLSRYELGVLPLFLLMAHVCFAANASRDFFRAAANLVGHRPGGLALASVVACAGFGAISGSSLATAATVGLVALPEMRERGYSDAFATGTVAAGGTLGQAVPPSGALIVFGIISEQSIGKLFTAAVVPALTQMLLYGITILLLCRLRPSIAPPAPRAGRRETGRSLLRVADVAVLILLVIGGIAIGWFTPSEAASVGAVGALALCAWRRRLSLPALWHALSETLQTSGMIYGVIVGALIFSVFISLTGLAEAIASVVSQVSGNRIVAMSMIAVVLLVLGSLLDGLALMLLVTPILLPIVVKLGLSPIWFGIFLIRAMEIGFVHPPVGMNLYVIHGIAKDVPISRIFRGVLPFLAADFVHLTLLILVPGLVLALPKWLGP